MAVQFGYRPDNIPPELAAAVGLVIIEWAMLSSVIDEMLLTTLRHIEYKDPPPMRFSERCQLLEQHAPLLLGPDSAEWKALAEFLHHVKSTKDKRDDVAHGIPGTITKSGKKFQGLQIPRWLHGLHKQVPITIPGIERVAARLRILKHKAYHLNLAVAEAHYESLQRTGKLRVLGTASWPRHDPKPQE